ncbi:unnamed protein product [Merluccius merluccius]
MKRRKQPGGPDAAAAAAAKASAGRRREKADRKRHKAEPKTRGQNPSDKPSRISCECQRAADRTPDRTRCAASPAADREGKENEERRRLAGACWVSRLPEDGVGEEEMGGGGGGGGNGIFPDDDSNQILPVEQFFGNLDAMQDGPQTVASGTGASLWAPRGENRPQRRRRRHYYAREDSEETELSDGDMQLGRPEDS